MSSLIETKSLLITKQNNVPDGNPLLALMEGRLYTIINETFNPKDGCAALISKVQKIFIDRHEVEAEEDVLIFVVRDGEERYTQLHEGNYEELCACATAALHVALKKDVMLK